MQDGHKKKGNQSVPESDSQSAEIRRKRRKRKSKGKKAKAKRRRYSSSSPDSSDVSKRSSDSEDYDHFNPSRLDETVKLPSNLRKFAQKHFGTYVKEEIMKKMLEQCPVPASPEFKVPKLDDEWGDVLEEDKKGFALKKWDIILLEFKILLTNLWDPLEQFG